MKVKERREKGEMGPKGAQKKRKKKKGGGRPKQGTREKRRRKRKKGREKKRKEKLSTMRHDVSPRVASRLRPPDSSQDKLKALQARLFAFAHMSTEPTHPRVKGL